MKCAAEGIKGSGFHLIIFVVQNILKINNMKCLRSSAFSKNETQDLPLRTTEPEPEGCWFDSQVLKTVLRII